MWADFQSAELSNLPHTQDFYRDILRKVSSCRLGVVPSPAKNQERSQLARSSEVHSSCFESLLRHRGGGPSTESTSRHAVPRFSRICRTNLAFRKRAARSTPLPYNGA